MRIALCEDDSVQADMFVRLLDKTADKLGIKAETVTNKPTTSTNTNSSTNTQSNTNNTNTVNQ